MDSRPIDNINSGINFNYTSQGKHTPEAELFNITDSFFSGQTPANPTMDLRKAAEILMRPMTIESLTKWSAQIGPMVGATPVLGPDGSLYVGSYDGKMYAFDSATGKKKWDLDLGGDSVSTSPLLKDGVLYCSGDSGKFFALDAGSGEVKWSKDFEAYKHVTTPVMAPDGTLYFGYLKKSEKNYSTPSDRFLVAMDSSTGEEKWRNRSFGGRGIPKLTIGDDGTLFTNMGDYAFSALDGKNGEEKWYKLLNSSGISTPVVKDGVVYVSEEYGRNLYAFDEKTGKQKWLYTTKKGHLPEPPTIGKDKIFISPDIHADVVIALDLRTGKQVWESKTYEDRHSGVARDKHGNLFVQGHQGNLYVLDENTGKQKLKLELDNGRYGFDLKSLSTPVVGDGGMVYMGNRNGKVYGFEFPYEKDLKDMASAIQTNSPGEIIKNEATVDIDGVVLNKRNKSKHFSFIEGNDLF